MKEEFSAHDMATAAADGFRDGQRAAQSAPAGEREAVEVVGWVNPSDLNLMSRYGYHSCIAKAVKVPCFTEPLMTVAQHERILAAWQRTQAAGVPDGWRPVPVASLERMLRFIDPAPVRMPNGDTMTFQNPHAAAALREISAEFRAMLAAAQSKKER